MNEIKTMLDRFAAAWKENDGGTSAAFFTEDGSLINPFGQRADGRAAIAAMYSEYFGSLLQGTSTRMNMLEVRPVEDDHALVDVEQTVYAPDGSVVLAVHLAALMRRDSDSWRFADARPYTFAAIPG